MNAIRKQGITGSMSQFDQYSTDTVQSALGDKPDKYTIPELLSMIRDIKTNFDPKILERLFLLMEEHIHNRDNPHNVTLESLNTTVIAELYKEWQADGYTGTIDDFRKVLFQYIEIADIPTTFEGTSESKLVSVKGAKTIYNDHIVNPNAHDEMWRAIFPGNAIDTVPKYSAQALVGLPENVEVTRNAEMIFHTPTGFFDVVPADTLAVDYLYKDPAYSIWGERTNMVLQSESLGSGNFIGGYSKPITNALSPNKDSKAIVFNESDNGQTSENGWESDEFNFVAGVAYTISTYVLPMDKQFFGFDLPEALTGCTRHPVYDLRNEDVSFHPFGYSEVDENGKTTNFGEHIILDNEWVKVVHCFIAQQTVTCSLKALWSDVLDGDMTYIGTDKDAGAMYQAQLERGVNASPPIFTQDFPVTRPGTVVKIPFGDNFNFRSGALVITTKKPYKIDTEEDQYLYELGDAGESTLQGKYTPTHDHRLLMSSFSKTRDILDQEYTGDANRDATTFVHAYDLYQHTYGNTGDHAKIHDISDQSVTFSNALDYMMANVYGSPGMQGAEVGMIDFTNNLVSSSTSVSYLTDVEVVELVLSNIWNKTKLQKGTDDLAVIDFLESDELTDVTLLNDNGDILFLGCSRNNANHLDGYIFDLTYYTTYVSELETEFLTGEYVHGT